MGRRKIKGQLRRPSGGGEMGRLQRAWDRAVSAGLMVDGTEVSYHALPDGLVLSSAVGADGQLLIDGKELTAEWANELRQAKPAFSGLVDIFEAKSREWVRISEMGPCEHVEL